MQGKKPARDYYLGKDSCQGDSGGPLIGASKYTGDEIRYSWLGIVSFGVGCAEVGLSLAMELLSLATENNKNEVKSTAVRLTFYSNVKYLKSIFAIILMCEDFML